MNAIVGPEPISLDTIADELYGLLPQDFTSTRNDLARAARIAGDHALSQEIRALRKPTAVAWLANQVVRQHSDMVESLVALGHELRDAMAAPNGPELRRLNVLQRDLVQALLQLAGELARSSGHPATEQVLLSLTDTLRAALADPQAAEALASGRLTVALPPPAFAGVAQDGEGAAAAPGPSHKAGLPAAPRGDADGAADRERARRVAAEAQDRAEAARHVVEQARASLDGARTRTRLAGELVERLREQLAEAQVQRDSAQEAEDAARSAHDRADRAAREAEERLRDILTELRQPPD